MAKYIRESDLIYNRVGKFSDHQRSRMRMGIVIRGIVGMIPLGLLVVGLCLIVAGGNLIIPSACWIPLGALALWTWGLSLPAFRHVWRLASDLRGAGVAEDCGVLTLEIHSRPGRSGGSSRNYICVDSERRYAWNMDIEGNFENSEMGCVYFGRNSKLVLSIETLTEEQIEKL